MNRVDRLFAIVTFIQGKQYVNADKIAAHFETSVRTVYRDLKALNESGIPIGFEPDKGYFLVDGYFTPPVAFTLQEANALLLSQRLVNGFSDRTLQRYFDSAITKVRSVMKKADTEKINALDERIKLQVPARLADETKFMTQVQEAICFEKQLKISYTNAKDESSERTIEPIGLVFYAFSWHVIAYCHLKTAYRDFKLSRIAQLTTLDTPFIIQKHIPLAEYQLPVNF